MHRDVKSENVFVATQIDRELAPPTQCCKLYDFGECCRLVPNGLYRPNVSVFLVVSKSINIFFCVADWHD